MTDEDGYYGDEERAAYRPESCEICGTTKTVRCYPDRRLSHPNGNGRWSRSPEMCPRPEQHAISQ